MKILKFLFRLLLGIAMLYTGIGHITFLRQDFYAQVPTWLTTDQGIMDFIVIASGIVEILFGLLMVWGGKIKEKTGLALAIFFVLIYPGNINQYLHGIDAFGLNSDYQRMMRLLFQPVFIFWALWSSNALNLLLKRKNK